MPPTSTTLENRLQTAAFVLFLALPLADLALSLDPAPAPFDVAIAARPAAPRDLASLDAWPERFDAYFRDHFGWRSWLIRRFHQLDFLLFRVSESREVVVGRDGWLFFGNIAASYQLHNRPFSRDERRRWLRSFVNRQTWLEQQGIHYLFTVAPNKHSIYPEKLPWNLASVGLPSRYEELVELLTEGSGVTPIDLHGPLRAAKARELVYERTGSHWNARGAYLAYSEIFDRLAPAFPQLRRVPWERVTLGRGGPADLSRMLGLEKLLPEERLAPVAGVRYPRPGVWRGKTLVTEQDDPSLPRAVIFHDSFGVFLAPYLAEHFSHATWVWRDRFDGNLVRRLRPDVVIEERVERHLMRPPIRNVFPPAEPVSSTTPSAAAPER